MKCLITGEEHVLGISARQKLASSLKEWQELPSIKNTLFDMGFRGDLDLNGYATFIANMIEEESKNLNR